MASPAKRAKMSKLAMAGSYVALVTPFTDADEVDYDKISELVDWHCKEGTAGIVPCGTTGENPTLTEEEIGKIFEVCVKAANKRCQIVAGAGSNSTKKAIALAEKAKAVGCDAILTVIPYYNKPTQDGIMEHFKAQAKVGVPMMLYNIPGRCGGSGMTSATIAELYKVPEVVAIKEATGSVDFATEIRSLCDIQIFSGDDSLTVPLMSVGAKGVVSVTANLAPKQLAQLCKDCETGNYAAAQKTHYELYALGKAMFCETNPVPCKAAGAMMGKWKNNLRMPMLPMTKANEPKLQAALKAAKLM